MTLKGAGGGGRVNGGGFPAEIWADFTAKAMGEPSEFVLDTDMGAAVAPPPDTSSPSTSTSPSEEATPSDEPTTQAPTTTPPATTDPPETTPPPSPTGDPTSDPPTDPSTEPGPSDSGLPIDPGGDNRPDKDNAVTR